MAVDVVGYSRLMREERGGEHGKGGASIATRRESRAECLVWPLTAARDADGRDGLP